MKRYAIAALAFVALGAAIALSQVFTMPPPAGVVVLGCVYQSSPPTLTTGQTAFAQCDSTGHIATGGGGGGGAITAPLGPTTAPSAAVATTDTGTPINGAALSTGGQGETGWLSQIWTVLNTNIYTPGPAGTPSAQVMTTQPPTSNFVNGTTAAMTGTTSTSLIAAVTSNRIYVTSISCVNSHATVGTFVTVQDGSGGTALRTMAAASVFGGDEANGGFVPLFKTTSGNGVFVADVTTGANVICNAAGFSGP